MKYGSILVKVKYSLICNHYVIFLMLRILMMLQIHLRALFLLQNQGMTLFQIFCPICKVIVSLLWMFISFLP